ncbi:Gag-Pol polyprotein [Elysia marginata]|uniref:ribonuclease H n=1 Tax=Elysia marginata TaxID=1093978 RepID=A0AAV4H1Q1_9GAST|nr:Gag-Pol polyprotein [Elysia marginata]
MVPWMFDCKFEENQDLLWQTDRYESLKLAESPWENNKVSISYTIPGIERKNEEDINNLRVKTLEHIDNTYPHDTWTHIYTDRSSDNMKAGGAGIHIWHSDGSKEDIAKATGSICSNFKAEVIAIKTALEHIQANQDNSGEEQKYIIFCDSQAALQSLEQTPTDQLSEAMAPLLKQNMEFQWIPSHCGIPGNERADRLAKEGSKQDQTTESFSYQEVKSVIKGIYSERWKAENTNYSFKRDMMHQLPRKEQCTIFRLRTGHCQLRAHQYRLGTSQTSMCECGTSRQTVNHLLQDCPLYTNEKGKLWPENPDVVQKLWGNEDDLLLTTQFIEQTRLSA